jgi:myosin heavy subunit
MGVKEKFDAMQTDLQDNLQAKRSAERQCERHLAQLEKEVRVRKEKEDQLKGYTDMDADNRRLKATIKQKETMNDRLEKSLKAEKEEKKSSKNQEEKYKIELDRQIKLLEDVRRENSDHERELRNSIAQLKRDLHERETQLQQTRETMENQETCAAVKYSQLEKKLQKVSNRFAEFRASIKQEQAASRKKHKLNALKREPHNSVNPSSNQATFVDDRNPKQSNKSPFELHGSSTFDASFQELDLGIAKRPPWSIRNFDPLYSTSRVGMPLLIIDDENSSSSVKKAYKTNRSTGF